MLKEKYVIKLKGDTTSVCDLFESSKVRAIRLAKEELKMQTDNIDKVKLYQISGDTYILIAMYRKDKQGKIYKCNME
jgi:hypothetical protein